MTDDSNKISRREFTALSLAAGVTAAAGSSAAAADMVDTDVEVKTADGTCEAALIHPKGKGQWPGVILFVDIFGLRPTMRDMAKRLAANGYTVLVPNPYYRTTKAPGLPGTLDFTSADDRAKIAKVREPMTDAAVMSDTTAYVKFLDAQAMVTVGTAVASRPPYRSRRALLTHRAPPSGFGVEAVTRQRVYRSDWRNESVNELDEPLPVEACRLAAPLERREPEPLYLVEEPPQARVVTRDSEVVQMPSQHLFHPSTGFRDRVVH